MRRGAVEISVEKEYNQHALNLQFEIDDRLARSLARFRPTLSLSSFFCFELSRCVHAPADISSHIPSSPRGLPCLL